MADSDSLFYLKTQFYLGAYRSVAKNPLPSKDSSEYLATLLYTARAHIALNDPAAALAILPADVEPAVRAVRALASYVQTKSSGANVDSILDDLRDLTIEIEGEEEIEGRDGYGGAVVKVAAATAFIQEGELEEALTTLETGHESQVTPDLECVFLKVQIYLSISRADLAKKEYARATSSHDNSDALLLQLIEASIGLVTGGNPLNSAYHIYDEQAATPGSSSNAAILSAKGVAYLLRGHLAEARGSFKEALEADPTNGDALVGDGVVKQLSGKADDADTAFALLQTTLPNHPLVLDLEAKSALFDTAKAQWAPTVAAA